MNDTTQPTTAAAPPALVLDPSNPKEREMMVREREFAFMQREANALASADIIPAQFKGKISDCMIAMNMAARLNTDPLQVMQNLYVVHGRPAFSAAYMIALVNVSGIIKGRLRFEYNGEGETRSCYAIGTDAETGEDLIGTTIDMAMADAEGWSKKAGSKWKTMPEQMLAYRAASFWSRQYAPDATMGMHTKEEVEDLPEKEINPIPNAPESSTMEKLKEHVDKETGEVIEHQPQQVDDQPAPDVVKNEGPDLAID